MPATPQLNNGRTEQFHNHGSIYACTIHTWGHRAMAHYSSHYVHAMTIYTTRFQFHNGPDFSFRLFGEQCDEQLCLKFCLLNLDDNACSVDNLSTVLSTAAAFQLTSAHNRDLLFGEESQGQQWP